ncbi:hypothetical protein RSSM_01646 [Rhodopirellula sallentina SM41]|uniref:Uncharacterized protein n=1 Tax=Rhodopirellula sallentina SM41 TaxID=1263870 RepID=M5U688_9BACT|nr:hypothetical protein RSSM_01646 [Rhodopirellula sallentina SM41]
MAFHEGSQTFVSAFARDQLLAFHTPTITPDCGAPIRGIIQNPIRSAIDLAGKDA